ncbi:hypothetical protein PQX77_000639, partial [Marasmius sp. AFHP31]
MGKYNPRNYRYLRPNQLYRTHDLSRFPEPQQWKDMDSLCPKQATTRWCRHPEDPLDGSFLTLAIEEPLPIDQLSKGGDALFRSREAIIFLNQHGIDLFPVGHPVRLSTVSTFCSFLTWTQAPACSGRMGKTPRPVWCKLVHERELNNYKALEALNPGTYHIATLLIEPHLLPTDQYLITMRDYGPSLFLYTAYSSWARERLCGKAIQSIAVQLCEAIAFLHSHCFFHLDIKPDNLSFDHITSRLTVLDLGWTIHSAFKKPGVYFATGTRDFAPPEVLAWFDWEDMDEDDPTPSPRSFDPRKAD